MYWSFCAMEAKIPIVIFVYWIPFTLFAARTVIETEQMTITSVWVIQILKMQKTQMIQPIES